MDVTVFVLVSCYFIAVFSTAECVVFEINDYDLNRVVFVYETNIVMTCSAPEFNDPQFEISHQSNIIIDSQDSFLITTLNKSIEVRITDVQAFHGGIYQCLVTGDGSMTLTNLTLDVRLGNSLYCPQSSETLNVNEGESLTLFCYFLWSADTGDFTSFDYIWQEKIEPNPVPLNNSTVTQSSSFVKGIVIAVVGPFTADDDNTVYECSHLMLSISGAQPCSVGPVNVKPRPSDTRSQTPTLQPVTVPATLTPIRLSSPPSTTTTYQLPIGPAKNTPTSSSTSSPPPSSSSPPSSSWVRKDITEEPMNNSTKTLVVKNKNIVIILLSIVVIILAIVITILLCHKSQCKRNKRKEIKKEEGEFQLRGHPASNSKQGKDEDGYIEPNPKFVNHMSGRSDVGVAMATGSSSIIRHDYEHKIIGIKKKEDDQSYEEVNHQHGMSKHNTCAEPTELVGDQDYEYSATNREEDRKDYETVQ